MLYLLMLMVLGVFLGYLLKEKNGLIKWVDKLTQLAIYGLLLLLGLQVGANEKITNNILELGKQSFLLSFCAILGSLLCSWAVYHFFFKKSSGK